MNKSIHQYTSGKKDLDEINEDLPIFDLDSWIDIQAEERAEIPAATTMSSFADRDLTSSMHVNENLLLEAQKDSSRVSSKSSHSDT